MRLSAHSDEKVHMRYVGRTAAMRQIPEAAVPQLPAGLFQSAQRVPFGLGADSKFGLLFEPPSRVELETYGLRNRCSTTELGRPTA